MSKNSKFIICIIAAVILGIILGNLTCYDNMTCTCFVMLSMLLSNSLED